MLTAINCNNATINCCYQNVVRNDCVANVQWNVFDVDWMIAECSFGGKGENRQGCDVDSKDSLRAVIRVSVVDRYGRVGSVRYPFNISVTIKYDNSGSFIRRRGVPKSKF